MKKLDFNFSPTLQLDIVKISVQLTRILCLVYTFVLMDGCLHLEALMGLLKSGMHLPETSSVHLNILVEASSESGSIEENIWGIAQFGCGMLTEVPTFYWENLVKQSVLVLNLLMMQPSEYGIQEVVKIFMVLEVYMWITVYSVFPLVSIPVLISIADSVHTTLHVCLS